MERYGTQQWSTKHHWYTFKKGKSIGCKGSENGVIIRDEENSYGARITLEKDTVTAPFAITCAIYNIMVHTCFFENEHNAYFEKVKSDLSKILVCDSKERTYELISEFVNKY